jgi:tRNA A37 threonylcarbamoyladenosine modification protein TsaB
MDAYRRDVFAALYRVTDASPFDPDRLIELDPPSVDSPASTWGRWVNAFGAPSVVIGDGAVLYEAIVGPSRVMRPPLLAGAIGRLAVGYMRRGAAVHPSAVHPLYVRRPDAEIAREKGSSR